MKYYNPKDILKLNLDSNIHENIKGKFGKRVYFELNDSCKIGKLCGLDIVNQDLKYYIIDIDGQEKSLPIYKSITLL